MAKIKDKKVKQPSNFPFCTGNLSKKVKNKGKAGCSPCSKGRAGCQNQDGLWVRAKAHCLSGCENPPF